MLSILLGMFKRKSPAVDRANELQGWADEEIAAPEETSKIKVRSTPTVVIYSDRESALERGYWLHHAPRRIKKCNVEIETLIQPGALRRLNRLVKRGYYRSLRHTC